MVCSMLMTLGLIAIAAGLLYVFLVWNFGHWKKRGAKGPKPTPIYGNVPNILKQKRNTAYDFQDIYNQFRDDEDFVGLYVIRTPQLMIVSPKLAQSLLVKHFRNFHDNELLNWVDKKNTDIMVKNPFVLRGEEWKEQRQAISPGLTPSRIKAMYPVAQQVCGRLVNYITDRCLQADIHGIDAKDLSLRYTCEVVSDCVLGIKAESLTDNPSAILRMTKDLFENTSGFMLYAFAALFFPAIRDIYKARLFKKDTEDFFLGLMNSAFDMRRQQSVDRVDFLNYILQLQEKKNLSTDDLASHSMTFLLDGFETSASVITHCLYQLAKKPSTQEELLKEVLANLNENGELHFDTLNDLPYLDQCLYESIRITPPLLLSTKLCTEKCELSNKNGKTVQMEPNDIVVIPVYCFHHDERYYPNPNEFIPERFSPENGGVKKFREMGVFYPFGDGPRKCLGMRFALTITKAAIADIVKNFKVKLNPKTRRDNLLHATSFIGSLDGGVWLNFEERKKY